MVEARTTRLCLWWLHGGREDSQARYLEGRTTSVGEAQEKSSTCLKQTLGEFVMPQPKTTITKSPVYVPGFMGT